MTIVQELLGDDRWALPKWFGRFLVVFCVMLAALPVARTYAAVFVDLANLSLSLCGIGDQLAIVLLDPPQDLFDAQVQRQFPDGRVVGFNGSTQLHGYLDTSFVFSLVLSAPAPHRRWLGPALLATLALQAFVLVRFVAVGAAFIESTTPGMAVPGFLRAPIMALDRAFLRDNLEAGLLVGCVLAGLAIAGRLRTERTSR